MINRPKQKTCWSVMANFFSGLSPSRLLIGYLYISGYVLNNLASAQSTETYYTRENRLSTEPSTACLKAAPGCVLSVKGMFSKGSLDQFSVKQECEATEGAVLHGRASLGTQLRHGLFHGNSLCDKTLTNKVLTDPIHSEYRHNTDYSVKFDKDDRVEVTHKPLFTNPNQP